MGSSLGPLSGGEQGRSEAIHQEPVSGPLVENGPRLGSKDGALYRCPKCNRTYQHRGVAPPLEVICPDGGLKHKAPVVMKVET